ncbi:MAG: NlpC/P60 family protein [Bacillota bacterium]
MGFLTSLLVLAVVVSGCSWLFGPSRPATAAEAERALAVALAQVGKPYEWGARGPDSFDCSGLITWAYRHAVVNLQLRDGWRSVDDGSMEVLYANSLTRTAPEPGDIVFLSDGTARVTHGGLFVRWVDGETLEFVNASSYFGQVVVDSWPLHREKRNQRFVAFGRLTLAR